MVSITLYSYNVLKHIGIQVQTAANILLLSALVGPYAFPITPSTPFAYCDTLTTIFHTTPIRSCTHLICKARTHITTQKHSRTGGIQLYAPVISVMRTEGL